MHINTMKKITLAGIVSIAVSANVLADHNSPFGAGMAGMPNDIHNTVIEDDLSGTEFMDFISQGAGALSTNRYSDDTNGNAPDNGNGGSSNAGGNGRGGRS
jgi:hypothetical protein